MDSRAKQNLIKYHKGLRYKSKEERYQERIDQFKSDLKQVEDDALLGRGFDPDELNEESDKDIIEHFSYTPKISFVLDEKWINRKYDEYLDKNFKTNIRYPYRVDWIKYDD